MGDMQTGQTHAGEDGGVLQVRVYACLCACVCVWVGVGMCLCVGGVRLRVWHPRVVVYSCMV